MDVIACVKIIGKMWILKLLLFNTVLMFRIKLFENQIRSFSNQIQLFMNQMYFFICYGI